MRVLVIPEDPRLDQYILKPVVERIFTDLGRAPRVSILSNPRLHGVEEALSSPTLADIVETYPMNDLFLVIVDQDGNKDRKGRAAARENEHPKRLFVCLAVEEIEVWMLAIHSASLSASWREICTEIHPKERFAHPFLRERAPKLDPGRGRVWAMRDLGGQWRGVLQRCPEIEDLKQRIRAWLDSRA